LSFFFLLFFSPHPLLDDEEAGTNPPCGQKQTQPDTHASSSSPKGRTHLFHELSGGPSHGWPFSPSPIPCQKGGACVNWMARICRWSFPELSKIRVLRNFRWSFQELVESCLITTFQTQSRRRWQRLVLELWVWRAVFQKPFPPWLSCWCYLNNLQWTFPELVGNSVSSPHPRPSREEGVDMAGS